MGGDCKPSLVASGGSKAIGIIRSLGEPFDSCSGSNEDALNRSNLSSNLSFNLSYLKLSICGAATGTTTSLRCVGTLGAAATL